MRKFSVSLCLLVTVLGSAFAGELEQTLGRNETRVRSSPHFLRSGVTVADSGLLERLGRLGYRRLKSRPEASGGFFYGHESFWIYRRAHRWNGRNYAATLIGLDLRRADGMILGALGDGDRRYPLDRPELLWIEPEDLSESLSPDRARRIPVDLDEIPEHAWRALLAAEDARFFDHGGVDARALARAALANVKKGGVAQGGSTLTQQLIKNRDLSPKRSLGRKASEAVRALWLESEYDKREILEAYLNQVYYGHVDGLAVHGIGAAARAFFSKPATKLTLAESATLAAVIQGPNRLSPMRHPERSRERRNWVLGRMLELGWAAEATTRAAREKPVRVQVTDPEIAAPAQFLAWVSETVSGMAAKRLENNRGVVVETTLDPYLQQVARETMSKHLARLRRDHKSLRAVPLSAALVALDATSGDVLAYVGGTERDGFDRVREARRQPGSTVKPFIVLEAIDRCGKQEALNAASRVEDRPVRVDLDPGVWEPQNYDREFAGTVGLREALADSRNVPLVRVARWCGFDATAKRFVEVGLPLPELAPPSFVLGSVEVTPLQLARAYTVFATPGRISTPRPVRRVERPSGAPLARRSTRSRRVVRAASAYLADDLLVSAVEEGTARAARIEGRRVAAKTGSSSELRDAWLAGHTESMVVVVWVGRDDDRSLGLPGSVAAAPLWRGFVEIAARGRVVSPRPMPRDVVERFIDPQTGLLVRERHPRARRELFRRNVLPPRDRFWRSDQPIPTVR